MSSRRSYMERGLQLAEKGRGQTSPNPMVGAVIVKDGRILGEAYHHAAGRPHAEINALNQAGSKAEGATLYVTLEPCNHYGRTPPCTEAIIEAGLRRVVVAMEDPNPAVNGEGIQALREAGIDVEVGLCEKEAKSLNEIYLKYVKTALPFVVLKNAASLDGKIATRTGDAKWISGEESRRMVHRLRGELDAILVGIGTVEVDNPRLTARLPGSGKDPTRVILDSRLRINLEAKVISEQSQAGTIIATTGRAEESKRENLREKDVTVLQTGREEVSLPDLLRKLAEEGITSVMVEGGCKVNTSFWEERLVDKLYYFLAPKILGGEKAVSAVGGRGVADPRDGIEINDKEVRQVGEDILVVGYPDYQNGKG